MYEWNDTQKPFSVTFKEKGWTYSSIQEKTSHEKGLLTLKKTFCSVDIEELLGPKFHQYVQSKQSVEEFGMELQKLAHKAFPTLEQRDSTG